MDTVWITLETKDHGMSTFMFGPTGIVEFCPDITDGGSILTRANQSKVAVKPDMPTIMELIRTIRRTHKADKKVTKKSKK